MKRHLMIAFDRNLPVNVRRVSKAAGCIYPSDLEGRTTLSSEDKTPSDEKTDNRAQNQGSDGADPSDGLFANSGKQGSKTV